MSRRRARTALTALAAVATLLALLPTATAADGRPTSAAAPAATTVSPLMTRAALPVRVDPGWGLDRLDQRHRPLDGRYQARSDGSGVTAYLIDGGLDATNAQFGGRAHIGTDLFGGNGHDCADEMGVGHGTFVAGIVGGTTTGVAPAVQLVAVKALACGEGDSVSVSRKQQVALVVSAARWVRRNAERPAVVNMSLAFDRPTPRIDKAVSRLISAGIPVVAAAGNWATDACQVSPARVPAVITVAASDRSDRSWREAGFGGTNTGRCIDLYAPGKNITSVLAEGGTLRYAGVGATSWATPFVTGAVAQYLQRRPTATPAKVSRWLRKHATVGVLRQVPSGTPNRLLFTG